MDAVDSKGEESMKKKGYSDEEFLNLEREIQMRFLHWTVERDAWLKRALYRAVRLDKGLLESVIGIYSVTYAIWEEWFWWIKELKKIRRLRFEKWMTERALKGIKK